MIRHYHPYNVQSSQVYMYVIATTLIVYNKTSMCIVYLYVLQTM